MTTFVEMGGPPGFLFVPAGLMPACSGGNLRDQFLLGMPADEVAALDEQAVLYGLRAVGQARARADAQEARLLVRLNALREGSRYVPEEAALELRCSPNAAAERLARAQVLVESMPRLLAAMDAGELEGYPAGRVVDTVRHLSGEDARDVDATLADKLDTGRLGYTDPTRLVRAARRLVTTVDPDGQTTRAREARRGRKVELIPGEDTMARLAADLPAEVAASAYARLDAMARRLRGGGDARTLDQLRADLYADLLLGRDPGGTPPTVAATVFLHVPIDAALGMSDAGCELAGYGPIPGPIARDIMTNTGSVWRKVLTDPASGAPLDVGRSRYRPTQAIRDYITVRDRECPHCHRPAQRCDIDHLQEWAADHGDTSAANGGAKCRKHHRLKNAPGWTLHYEPTTGTATITTPGGRTHTARREPIIEPNPPPDDDPDPILSDHLAPRYPSTK